MITDFCRWWKVPYYWIGIKVYDLVAGTKAVKPSYLLGKSKALSQFPMLKKDQLKAAIVYYDGNNIICFLRSFTLERS